MVKVSVIVPVFNAEEYLGQCLDSLLHQTLEEIEIICVDDGSTDSSLEILHQYGEKDNRIQVLTQHNSYAGAARNLGLKAAVGEYLMFLDSDDFFESEMLQVLYEQCIQDQADVCVCGGRIYDQSTDTFKDAPHYLNLRHVPEKRPFSSEEIASYIFNFVQPAPWTKLFRREFVVQEGIEFQVLPRTNDLFFVYTALACAKRITVADRVLVNYRIGNANSLQTTNFRSPFDFYKALSALQQELKRRGIFETFEKSFCNRALDTAIYNLNKASTRESFFLIRERMRNSMFCDLGLLHHTDGYYYSRRNCQMMREVMDKGTEAAWRERNKDREPAPLQELLFWKNPLEEDWLLGSKKVSVIIPVYNVQEYLRECLDSVVRQTLKEIEIICVDDGSTDESLKILREYEGRDLRVKVIQKENGGLSSARNAGMQAAAGEYVYFLDSDDYLDLQALEFLYSEARAADLDQLFFSAEVFYDSAEMKQAHGGYDSYYSRKESYSGIFTGKELFARMVWNNEFRPSACLQINKRSFLQENHLQFKEGLIHEDHLFTMEAMALSRRSAYANINLYKRRLREASIMTGTKEFRRAYSFFTIYREMEQFILRHQLNQDEAYGKALRKQLRFLVDYGQNLLKNVDEELIHEELDKLPIKDSLDFYMMICFGTELKKRMHSLQRDAGGRRGNLKKELEAEQKRSKRLEKERNEAQKKAKELWAHRSFTRKIGGKIKRLIKG